MRVEVSRNGFDGTHHLRHDGWAYRGEDDLVEQLMPFLQEGAERGEPMLVLERQDVNVELAARLAPAAATRVTFIDVQEAGRNPGRILPIWHDFVTASAGRPARGVAEPLWPGRSPAEAAECHVHEALVNRLLAAHPVWVVCPYDVTKLSADDLDQMTRTHPVVSHGGHRKRSDRYHPEIGLLDLLSSPLPEPPWAPPPVPFGLDDLAAIRWAVEAHAAGAGFATARRADVAVVVSELATNSIRHGGGGGTLRTWTDGEYVVHEVRDTGGRLDPAAGRRLPPPHEPGGRGLWLVNRLSDLVQVRTSDAGTTIRVSIGPR